MTPAPESPFSSGLARLSVVTLLTGLGAGLAGLSLALLLRAVQHLAYGYSVHQWIGHESFLSGVDAASPIRRVEAMTVAGLVAGIGWGCLYRYGKPLMSVAKAVKADDPRMPVISTIVHAVLQIVTVALGSPLGREVAPRELGALFAGWLAHFAQLPLAQSRLIVACGAGAGLAAVYNVPLGGAVFILEVLLQTFDWPVALMALTTSSLAAWVASTVMGDVSQYQLPALSVDGGLIAWSLLIGPLVGVAAYGFTQLTGWARSRAPRRSWQLPLLALLNFVVIGVLAIKFPALLGNGKSATQLGLSNALTVLGAMALLMLKVAITASTLRAGAEGGLLTPGLTIGALLAVVLGGLWTHALSAVGLSGMSADSGAYALIGAAAFLATSMKMPLTAIVLIAEFARIDHAFLLPILFAVCGAIAAGKLCSAHAAG